MWQAAGFKNRVPQSEEDPYLFLVGVGRRGTHKGSMEESVADFIRTCLLSQLVPVREMIPVRDESQMD